MIDYIVGIAIGVVIGWNLAMIRVTYVKRRNRRAFQSSATALGRRDGG